MGDVCVAKLFNAGDIVALGSVGLLYSCSKLLLFCPCLGLRADSFWSL